MGLDMFFSAKRYIWFNEGELQGEVAKAFPNLPEGVKPQEVSFEVGYWRKANHIHRWFVDNVQDGKDDCGDYWVSDEKVDELLDICEKVLADHSLAEELLPTQSGFFFGGTAYDEFYISDVEKTVEIMKRAKELRKDRNYQLEYRASW